MRRRLQAILAAAVVVGLATATPAAGYWRTSPANANGTSQTEQLHPPTAVTLLASNDGTVAVSWTGSAGALVPTGYFVTRSNGSTTAAACSSSADNPITTTSCSDTGLTPGSYTYTVTAIYKSWTAPSEPSSTVVGAVPEGSLRFVQNPQSGQKINQIIGTVVVQVRSSRGIRTRGVTVTIALGNAGNGATLGGTKTAVSDQNGNATYSNLTVSKAGTYALNASAPEYLPAISNTFTVIPGDPASIAVIAGTPQSAKVGTQFASPLAVVVKDQADDGIPNVQVTFTPPSSGASGTVAGGSAMQPVHVLTDANGIANPAFTANSTPGSYSVTATANGVATPATFRLTNTP